MTHPTHPLITPAEAAGAGPCGTCASSSVMAWATSALGMDAQGRPDRPPRDWIRIIADDGSTRAWASMRCAYLRSTVPHPRHLVTCPWWQAPDAAITI